MPGTVHTLPSSAATASAAACSEGRSRLPSHRSDHEIHTPEHRHQQHAQCPDMVSEILDMCFMCIYIVAESIYWLYQACPSICLSTCMCDVGSHWMDLRDIWQWWRLWKFVKKIQVWLIWDYTVGQFAWRCKCVYIVDSTVKLPRNLSRWIERLLLVVVVVVV